MNILILLLQFQSFLILMNISPMNKILILIFIYLFSSFILLILDNYFLGLTYIIVYIGAIAILFLFVIMMMNLQDNLNLNLNRNRNRKLLLLLILLLLLLTTTLTLDKNILEYQNINWYYNYIKLYDINIITLLFMNHYNIILILIGLLLWIILIGILNISKS